MMITRCPQCRTTFRVTPEQLRLRQGRVRCGECMTSFDALASLAEDGAQWPAIKEPGSENDDPATPAPEDAALADVPRSTDARVDERIEPTIKPEPEPGSSPPEPDPDMVPPIDERASEALPAAEQFEPTAQVDTVEAPAPIVAPPHEPAAEAGLHEPTPTPHRWPWLIGCSLALMALALQGAVHFRTTLAARVPESGPWLAMLCEPLGCALDLPRRIDLIEIESSDLAPVKDAGGHLQLVATLRNRASFAQACPHLELTLTSAGDRALLRRALAPGEYLGPLAPTAAGFAARGDQTVQLDLQVEDTPAVGYRLYLFYP